MFHRTDSRIETDSGAAPFLLTATVDLRAYGESKGYRRIPIGYSATDTGALPMLQDYLVCRSNTTERLDFYALNSYRWCGQSTFSESGYNVILQSTENYPVPIFFSEVGVRPSHHAARSCLLTIFAVQYCSTKDIR